MHSVFETMLAYIWCTYYLYTGSHTRAFDWHWT